MYSGQTARHEPRTHECTYIRVQCDFFFNDTATTEIYTLSLHDALPILSSPPPVGQGETCPSRQSPPWYSSLASRAPGESCMGWAADPKETGGRPPLPPPPRSSWTASPNSRARSSGCGPCCGRGYVAKRCRKGE